MRAPGAAPHAVLPAGRDRLDVLTIRLPLTFTAFCAQHTDVYLDYLRLHGHDEVQARHLMESMLGSLVQLWPQALRSEEPAAFAWSLLTALAGGSVPGGGPRGGAAGRQRDVVLLCQRLSLTPAQAAAAMGVDEGTVATHLGTARRRARVQD
ncbi:sigma factor-like helix-turn-helix DNA-binding protein [Streptomyces sp. NPDC021093]|uniref:sigma factor-like helix-turn-helix DNA-binding protein n=1 Tax=Streptomyces sp. NPDC021093 TaxID=3365112 RepID=UPI0037AF8071